MFSPDALIAAVKRHASGDGLWLPDWHAKGATIFDQGEERNLIILQLSGLTKLAYQGADGSEWIKSLIVDAGLFGTTAQDGEVSRFAAICIEPSRLVSLPGAWLRRAVGRDAGLAEQVAAFNRWLVVRKQAREEALLCLTAEQRYLALLREDAALLARLTQADIARYLRITPIAFSRIKRRIAARISPE